MLLVDDEPQVRDLLERVLRDAGGRILLAATAAEALAVADAESVDVLITDVNLRGGVTGLELAAQLRPARPALQVLYMSGWYDHVDFPAVDGPLLKKPFSLAEFRRVVAEALERAGAD